MDNQFLGLMLDPFVDGRSGVGRRRRRPRSASRRSAKTLPDDIALAYSSVLKAPPAKAPSFEQRWSVMGRRLWRLEPHVRRSGGARQP